VGGGQRPEGFSQRFVGGYALALAQAGLPFQDALILRDNANLGPFSAESAVPPACAQIVRLKPRPTAAVGRGETITGLVRGLADRGIAVPDGISVVGHGPQGETPWPSSGISWVDYSARDMAEAGLDALDARGTACRSVTIPVRLVSGISVKANGKR